MEKLELDMREEVRRFDFIEFANLNLSCVYANIYIIVSLFNARFKTLKQKYESYRFEGDPNEVGHVVTTRCTTREDASDVRCDLLFFPRCLKFSIWMMFFFLLCVVCSRSAVYVYI